MSTYSETRSEVPQYAEAIVESLSSIDLFVFSPETRQEVDRFYERMNLSPRGREQSRALSLLHAAEFALMPAFSISGGEEGPSFGDAITVSPSDARLGLLKGDCSLIVWTHATEEDGGIANLTFTDLMVFGGDISKFRLYGWPPTDSSYSRADLSDYFGQLDSAYQGSTWEPASQARDNGALALQWLLWQLKLAVVRSTTEGEFRQEVSDAFGIVGDYVSQLALPHQGKLARGPSIDDQLNQLGVLREQGVLTDEEFAAARTRLLEQE